MYDLFLEFEDDVEHTIFHIDLYIHTVGKYTLLLSAYRLFYSSNIMYTTYSENEVRLIYFSQGK